MTWDTSPQKTKLQNTRLGDSELDTPLEIFFWRGGGRTIDAADETWNRGGIERRQTLNQETRCDEIRIRTWWGGSGWSLSSPARKQEQNRHQIIRWSATGVSKKLETFQGQEGGSECYPYGGVVCCTGGAAHSIGVCDLMDTKQVWDTWTILFGVSCCCIWETWRIITQRRLY